MSDAPRNVPVPDELAAVRAEIKRLEIRDAELRRLLLDNPDLRTGASYAAEIRVVTQDRTDLKEMRAMYPDTVAEFTFPQEITHVVLMGISEDGELIPARQMRTIEKAT